ncbi:MAG: hypothetical protein A3E83_04920 [Gammaproteobacteria bacterium RIFCSPHIGHO2_12_FULL_41_20]|nr:MAG: hypothetical protein A3E83_04920 [Gammaproteobacteria bacterium RIFCSPHIGHO2_12_FULL_41_20]
MFVFSKTAYAVGPTNLGQFNLQTMLTAFQTQVPALMKLVTAVAYVMGMYFIIIAVIGLKHFGESRSMMSQEHSLKGPLIFFAIGTALMYLPSAVSVGLTTFWSSPTPYAYQTSSTGQWNSFVSACFLIVQLIGTISFIRGLVILSRLGGHGGQPETFSKGMTHVIGGILCINIYQFVQVIAATFGIQWSWS